MRYVLTSMLALTLYMSAFAQDYDDYILSERPLSEFEIRSYVMGVNPLMEYDESIGTEADIALRAWVDYLISSDDYEHRSLFVSRNEDYSIIMNMWRSSNSRANRAVWNLFDDKSTLILRNFKTEDLEQEIRYSETLGISLFNVRPKGVPEESMDICLILLK